jgi:hypothetical protein
MASDEDGNNEMDLDEFGLMIRDVFAGNHDH